MISLAVCSGVRLAFGIGSSALRLGNETRLRLVDIGLHELSKHLICGPVLSLTDKLEALVEITLDPDAYPGVFHVGQYSQWMDTCGVQFVRNGSDALRFAISKGHNG
ncbi:MAG: hypothetical protein M2R45_01676 [Verrucomicrobia subdivision 3 bacterium]|nr:hypothetical protein [Limisphaerales bacterium]